ncbi:MAG: hypothetical protein B7733_01240 [Myxococcales bacterium FL481]|nr:MAG: hypothetical protein B7733_01240 [Myxococcales bacterium FL481]
MGARAGVLLQDRFEYAVSRADPEAMKQEAASLRSVDPYHVGAHLHAILAAESVRRPIAADRLSLSDALDFTFPASGWDQTIRTRIGRLDRLARTRRLSPGESLSRISHLLAVSAVGDAKVALDQLLAREDLDAAVRSLGDTLTGFVALALGDDQEYAAWRRTHAAESSAVLAWSNWLLSHDPPEPVVDLLREEQRRGFRAQFHQPKVELLALVKDPDAPADLRQAAAAQLSDLSLPLGELAHRCLDDDNEDCAERLDAYELLAVADDYGHGSASDQIDAMRRFATSESFPTGKLRFLDLTIGESGLDPLDDLLHGMRTRAAATGTAALEARLRLALARDDGPTLERLLNRDEFVLAPAQRILWRLAQSAIGQAPEVRASALDALWWYESQPYPPTDGRPRTTEQIESATSSYANSRPWDRWHRAHVLIELGAYEAAIDDLKALLEMVPGAVAAPLLGRLHLAHQRAGQPQQAEAWRTRLERDFPRSVEASLASARALQDAQQWAEAARAFAQAWRHRPISRIAARGFLQCSARAEGLTRLRKAVATSPVLPAWSDDLRALVLADTTTAAGLAEVLAAYDDDRRAFQLPPQTTPTELASRATRWAMEQIRSADDGAAAVEMAQRLVEFHSARDSSIPGPGEQAWLHFLSGNSNQARDAADQAGDESLRYRIAALMPLRTGTSGQRIDDELAWAIWRSETGRDPKAVEDVTALLEQLPRDPATLWYACRRYLQADMDDVAVGVCGQAWKRRPASAAWFRDLAVAVSYLAVNRSADAERVGLHARALRRLSRAEREAIQSEGGWWYNRALAQARAGRRQAALASLERAWVAGFLVTLPQHPPELPAFLSRGQGLMGRVVYVDPTASRGDILAFAAVLAIANGELDQAKFYADAAARTRTADPQAAVERTLPRDLLPIVRQDLERNHLRLEAVHDLWRVLSEASKTSLAELHRRYPDSLTVQLFWAQSRLLTGHAKKLTPIADALVTAHPRNGFVLTMAATTYFLAGKPAQARQLVQQGLAVRPQDTTLRTLAEQMAIGHEPTELPAWLRSAAAFDDKLRKLAAPASPLTYHLAEAENVELFLPPSAVRDDDDTPAFTYRVAGDGDREAVAQIRVGMSPSPGRCEPTECARQVLAVLGETAFEPIWQDTETLPAGEAGRVLLRQGESLLMFWVIPIPERMVFFAIGAPVHAWPQILPVLRAARDTVRPLDAALSHGLSVSLRNLMYSLPADPVRAQARALAANKDATRCPIIRLLDDIESPPSARSLLLDTFLASADVRSRQALTRCRAPHHAEAELIGLAALLSDDTTLHAYGRAVIRAAPKALREYATRVLAHGGWESSALRGTSERDDLPYGALQVAAALPKAEREHFLRALLQAASRHAHVLGLGAAVVSGQPLPADLRHADIRHASPSLATLAILALPASPEVEDLAAVRARLAAMDRVETREELRLLHEVVRLLAAAGSAQDLERLAGANDLAKRNHDREAARLRRAIDTTVGAHATAVQGGADSEGVGAERWLIGWGQGRREATAATPVSRVALQTMPLAELLPAGPWRIVRVHEPGVMQALLRDLVKSLALDDRQTTMHARRLLVRLAERRGRELLDDGSGIDRGAAIECAAPDGLAGFACSARLSDRDGFLGQLAQHRRRMGTAVNFLLHAAEYSTQGAFALGSWPTWLHHLATVPGQGPAKPAELVSEGVRAGKTIAGFDLFHHMTVSVREGEGARVDGEYYLVVGDRLWVFSDARMARLVLSRSPDRGGSLAQSPRYRALASARARGLISTIVVAQSGRADDHAVTVTVDSDGIHSSWVQADQPERGDIRPLLAALPDGAAAMVASSTTLAGEPLWSVGAAPLAVELGVPPPDWLGRIVAPVAWAWYPQPDAPLWSDWLAIVPRTRVVERQLAQDGVRVRTGRPSSRRGSFHAMPTDRLVVLGSSPDLVRRTAQRSSAAVVSGGPQLVSGQVDPTRFAPAISRIEAQITDRDRLNELTAVQRLLSTVAAVEMSAQSHKGMRHIDAHIRLRSQSVPDADQLEIVDEWLATRGIKNSTALPTNLDVEDTQRRVSYRLALPQAEARAARLFPPALRSRLEIRVLDDSHLLVTVQPDSPSTGRVSLTRAERRRLIAATPEIQANAPRIRNLARRLTREAKTPVEKARRIYSWVAENLEYELHSRRTTALDVLASKRGDCSEYSELTVALLRAAQIPAEIREGVLAAGSHFTGHAWVAFFDGTRWVEIDPANNQFGVGSGHLEARLMDLLPLLSLDQFKVVAVKLE